MVLNEEVTAERDDGNDYYDYFVDNVIGDNLDCSDGVDSSNGVCVYYKKDTTNDTQYLGDMTAIDLWAHMSTEADV